MQAVRGAWVYTVLTQHVVVVGGLGVEVDQQVLLHGGVQLLRGVYIQKSYCYNVTSRAGSQATYRRYVA